MAQICLIDTYALIEVVNVCANETARGAVLAQFTREVQAGTLSFPDSVAAECRAYLGDGICTVWIEAVGGHRKTEVVPHAMTSRALALCPGLVDPDNPDVQAQPEIGAMACSLLDQGLDVSIVTNDFVAMTDRTPLADACPLLGVPRLDIREYIEVLGYGQHLSAG